MVRIISALLLAATAAFATAAEPLELVSNPPDRHVVVKGDTLWGISGKFLQKPWRWPEIWRLNKDQIKNPHLIYPGDIVWLDLSDGTPRLRLGKPVVNRLQPQVHATPLGTSIPSIPPNAIEPFISQPLIIEQGADKKAARIVATQEDRVLLGSGDQATSPASLMPASRNGTSSAPARRSPTRKPARSSAMKPSSSATPNCSARASRQPCASPWPRKRSPAATGCCRRRRRPSWPTCRASRSIRSRPR